MKNMKFKINSPKHSEEIHKELRRLSILCSGFKNTKAKFIITDIFEFNGLFYTDNESDFIEHPYTETTLEELKAM